MERLIDWILAFHEACHKRDRDALRELLLSGPLAPMMPAPTDSEEE